MYGRPSAAQDMRAVLRGVLLACSWRAFGVGGRRRRARLAGRMAGHGFFSGRQLHLRLHTGGPETLLLAFNCTIHPKNANALAVCCFHTLCRLASAHPPTQHPCTRQHAFPRMHAHTHPHTMSCQTSPAVICNKLACINNVERL